MSHAIFKYDVKPGAFTVEMPARSTVLCVQTQHGQPKMWAMVNATDHFPTEPRHFVAYGTGHPIPDDGADKYIGTFQLEGGRLVFHVFEVWTPAAKETP